MLLPDKGQRRFYLGISVRLLLIGVLLEMQVPAILLFGAITIGHAGAAYRQGLRQQRPGRIAVVAGVLALHRVVGALAERDADHLQHHHSRLQPACWSRFHGSSGGLRDQTGSSFFTDLANAKLAPPGEAIAHYNKWQIPFAFIVSPCWSPSRNTCVGRTPT